MSKETCDIFIIGAKGFVYGGYETFLDKLTEYHQENKRIHYHIACKANGKGVTDESKLSGVKYLSDTEYIYHNAHCFKIMSPELGTAQAILYDIKALQYCCNYIKDNNIEHPIVYVLSSRVGFCMGYFARKIHNAGGKYWNNPDGRESLRRKYNSLVRKYWALSERGMVKHSNLVICDNRHIEQYIQDEYRKYEPMTTYIAYGSDIEPSEIADDAPQYKEWLANWKLKDHEYYISVGRFVPENNFEVMIREFMKSNTKKDFAIITTENNKFLEKLDEKLHFKKDSRIKFVGTVYDRQLLKKIRENAYGYIHGHEVGGTNPSLLEALGSTDLNLVFDVGFNRECGADGALYWGTNDGDLAHLIDDVDKMKQNEINALGCRARRQIQEYYSWQFIANEYENLFLNRN